MKNLLIIDDDPDIGEFISEVGRMAGYDSVYVSTFDEFRTGLTPDVSMIMVDLVMPGKDGIEILRYLGESGCQAGIVLISGLDRKVLSVSEDLATELGLNVLGHFQKPVRLAELEALFSDHVPGERKKQVSKDLPLAVDAGDIERAIEEEQFVVHYQPQVDIRTGRAVGVEALVRWNHPVYGLLMPAHFIATAEREGLIDRLTWRVVSTAMTDMDILAKQGWALRVAFNLSALSLRDLGMPEVLAGWADSFNVKPGYIIIEITESGLIAELAKALDILTRLRVKGFGLSIDDFGTGYSMLQQLQRIPATELKIDKSFVSSMLIEKDSYALVRKVIELGHDLDMEVLAEGVETRPQLTALGDLGCDIAQGYLFSRPVAAASLLTWLRAQPEKESG